MKDLFDQVSFDTSKLVTNRYSTSFSMAVKMLSPTIRYAIYNIDFQNHLIAPLFCNHEKYQLFRQQNEQNHRY